MLLSGQKDTWIQRSTSFDVSVSLKMLMKEVTELRCGGAMMLLSPLKCTKYKTILDFHQKELLFSTPVQA
ncbi:hypothetical protein SAMN02799630_03994 [Paenibacillus sp. UNCCL117]|nr:hypothetical protein SAMN04488602_11359 [Paenibacillus sp. cl123]SFW52653.1 hypothetical protein SAMN02799630_03994 [Paenibacillus sp. UNCCL117]